MGMGPFRSYRDDFGGSPPPVQVVYVEVPSKDLTKPAKQEVSGNPDPRNYEILRTQRVKNNLVVEIKYPDCMNYEGRKIMVYANLTIRELLDQVEIDPHFSDGKFLAPIARFEPTPRGWKFALQFARNDF